MYLLNLAFLKIFCVKSNNATSYWYEGPTHDFIIDNQPGGFNIEVYDGANVVKQFTTNNLWTI